jgi:hypothetical protein
MTPKEKAKELIDKFVLLDNDIFCSINYLYSKQCALIAVAEIINVTVGLNGWIDGFQYWEEVKQEIEKL